MISNSPNKIVLCATANSLLAGVWRAGMMQGCQIFANNSAGHLDFAEFLQQHPATPVHLLVDAVEEDYRLESLPHSAGHAKRELVERKLNQFYRGLEYRAAHFINRDKDKRKDDRYLFVALNNADFMQGWVGILQSAEALLVAVNLLPMLSQVLVRQQKLMAPDILLCEKLSSGLRQTYLHNGRLRMSRLVPNVPAVANQHGNIYLVEIEKLRLYLISQRFISSDTPISLVLTSVDGSSKLISQAISQEQVLVSTDINLSKVAKSLSLSADLVQKFPQLLHMQLIANGHVVDNLAPTTLTKPYQFNKVKQALKVGTLLLGFIGLCVAGWVFKQGLTYKDALNTAKLDTVIQQHRYDEVAKNFPLTPISADELKIAVEINQHINNYPKSPRRMMEVVSTALAQSPEIQLDRLRWVLSNDLNTKDEDTLTVLPTESTQTSTPPITVEANTLAELGFVNAEISNFNGDYRAALNTVHKFVENLKADSNVAAIEVLQEPVNVSSYVNLQGSTTDDDEQNTQQQPATFKLKILLNAADITTTQAEIK